MRVKEIENAIAQLFPEELAELSARFADYQAKVWDEQIERDLDEGRLDALLEKVVEEYEAGEATTAVSTLIVSVGRVISEPVLTARHFERSREISPMATATSGEVLRRCSERPAKGFEITHYIKNEA